MSIEIGQPVRVAPHHPMRGATGQVMAKEVLTVFHVRLDSGEACSFLYHELRPINDASQEGWIGGTDAEDDEVQERSEKVTEFISPEPYEGFLDLMRQRVKGAREKAERVDSSTQQAALVRGWAGDYAADVDRLLNYIAAMHHNAVEMSEALEIARHELVTHHGLFASDDPELIGVSDEWRIDVSGAIEAVDAVLPEEEVA